LSVCPFNSNNFVSKKISRAMATKKAVLTPLMKQYYNIKAKHPDAILLFRVGDFYETFEDDAVKTAGILGITLTKRANGSAQFVDLAGFPYHALETYLPKLVRAGQRVAICEQLEDPKQTKKIVKRGITEMVTPGVTYNENVIEGRSNNFLASIVFSKKETLTGLALLDITTGEFMTTQGTPAQIEKLLFSFQPKEIIYWRAQKTPVEALLKTKFYAYPLEDWPFNYDSCYEKLTSHFGTKSLKGFGIEAFEEAIRASGAVLHYLDLTEHKQVEHIKGLSRIDTEKYVWLDQYTIRNLELFQPISPQGKTLIETIDDTISPMGARLLRRWVAFPQTNIDEINRRASLVEHFLQTDDLTENLQSILRSITDLERLAGRLAANRVVPRELAQLRLSLEGVQAIKKILSDDGDSRLKPYLEQLNVCESLLERLKKELVEAPGNAIGKQKVIADGVSKELDELRHLLASGKSYLDELLQREIKNTGITSLKIKDNNVFGYYIEVTNAHKDKVPPEWIRKQTLVNAERYITEELKEYEAKILGAEEKILKLEQELYQSLILDTLNYISAIQLNAQLIAELDVLLSFAQTALEHDYHKPVITKDKTLIIKQGRHPVIEQQLPVGERYIPNDVLLDSDKQQIIIITGPNMSGKSALLRQTALITLLAQIGSFVPAKSATIGVVDKIFTRVGASDNLALGESTFMVEMMEVASILNNLSDRSLILLDEIGRGTSTYDGVSIAWAIAEYLHENGRVRPKTLFATHYHELNEMEKSFKRIVNYHVSVQEHAGKILFERTLKKGGTAHSFGVHVAEMAGVPASVVQRSKEILKELEGNASKSGLEKPIDNMTHHKDGYQLSFFQLDDPLLLEIKDIIQEVDVNNLTPIEALNVLNSIQQKLKKKK